MWVLLANLKGKAKKLQTALVKNGVIVKINQNQFYSEDQKRMITQYRVIKTDKVFDENKNIEVKKDEEIIKTCSMVEVINTLLDIYKKVLNG